jgi:large subunit ribosomal protein L4
MEVAVYKIDGTKSGSITLPAELFGVELNTALVHEAVVAQDANSRIRIAQTKDRSEVRGGGRKPWKQKGTGRARHGSRRSPIWIGGGITFGPIKDRNFSKKMNRKAKQKAIKMVLSDRAADERLIVVEDYAIAQAKTKLVADVRQKLPGAGTSGLLVLTSDDKDIKVASQNLPKTETISVSSLNVRDLLIAEYVFVSKAGLEKMKDIYTN